MPRPLPSLEDARRILAAKRSRPAYRPAPTLGRSLGKLVKALDERFGQGADGLKDRWREIAGDRLAARTEPVRLIKGRNGAASTLEIKVEGPSAALIQHQAPEILARVRLFLGADAVDRLRIVQGPLRPTVAAPPGVAAVKARRRRRTPLDAAEEARLQAELSQAPDGPLKAALLRLGREVMRAGPAEDLG